LEQTGFDLTRFDDGALARFGPDPHRAAAFELFKALPVPGARDEEWRHSPAKLFPFTDFQLSAPPCASSAPPANDCQHDFDAVIEITDETFSSQSHAAALEILPLGAAPISTPQHRRKFAALGQAFWNAGFFVRAHAGAPVRLLVNWRFAGAGQIQIPRLVVIAEPDAKLTLVERFQTASDATPGATDAESETRPTGNSGTREDRSCRPGLRPGENDAGPRFHGLETNRAGFSKPWKTEDSLAVIGAHEFHVGAGAVLERVALHEWNAATICIAEDLVHVAGRGRADWVTAVLGGRAVKLTAGCDVAGAGAEANLSGLYFADGAQHVDQRTLQRHSAPDTTSHLLYKGAVRDQSHTIYQGLIQAARGAVRVDAYQMNRNLVLNEGARADSLPGLEIDADDLKCSHGSATGSLDPEQLFYLRARGVPEAEARRLLVDAFFEEVIGKVSHERVREHLRAAVARKMEAAS
jgi:Fe-S cluster assembly scaffold protein SufB